MKRGRHPEKWKLWWHSRLEKYMLEQSGGWWRKSSDPEFRIYTPRFWRLYQPLPGDWFELLDEGEGDFHRPYFS